MLELLEWSQSLLVGTDPNRWQSIGLESTSVRDGSDFYWDDFISRSASSGPGRVSQERTSSWPRRLGLGFNWSRFLRLAKTHLVSVSAEMFYLMNIEGAKKFLHRKLLKGYISLLSRGYSLSLAKTPLLLGPIGLRCKSNGSGPSGRPGAFPYSTWVSCILFAGSHSSWSFGSFNPGGSSTQGDETQHSTTPVVEEEFPFTILFREAQESDSEGLPSWIDPGVSEVNSVYKSLDSLVGMDDAICCRGPWSVEVLPCRSDEIVCEWAAETEEPFFYLYETMFTKLGI
ncbi:hypothetical protein CR513_26541, partial [Mucuna pruriens]